MLEVRRLFDLLDQPIVVVAGWMLIAGIAWRMFGARYRLVAVSAATAAFTVLVGPALEAIKAVPFAWVVGTGVIFLELIFFFGALVVAADRWFRGLFPANLHERPVVAYSIAVGVGAAALAASIAGLWWVNEVHTQLQGTYDLGLFGGVFTAILGLVRADRRLASVATAEGRASADDREEATGGGEGGGDGRG